MNQEWFSSRLTKFRTDRNLSARDMSLSLGQSAGYINKIENMKSLPSMNMFFYICQYLHISPQMFFDENITQPILIQEALAELQKMDATQLEHLIAVMKDINTAQALPKTTKKSKK